MLHCECNVGPSSAQHTPSPNGGCRTCIKQTASSRAPHCRERECTATTHHNNKTSQGRRSDARAFKCASGQGHVLACSRTSTRSQYPRGVSRLAALEGSLSTSRRGPSGQPEVAVRTLPLHTVLNLTLPRAVLWHHMCCMCGSTGKGLNGAILVTAVRDVGRRQHGVPSVST